MDSIRAVVQDLISDQHAVEYAFLDISQHHEVELYDLNQRRVEYYSPGTTKAEGRRRTYPRSVPAA